MQPPTSAVHGGPYDLDALFLAVGQFAVQGAPMEAPTEREVPTTPAELIDVVAAPIHCGALEVAGFVDGIQNGLIITWRERRPVYLMYYAAGAIASVVTGDGNPIDLMERLTIVCAEEDREWAESLGTNIPIEVLEPVTPPELSGQAVKFLRNQRDDLERQLIERLGRVVEHPLVVDGHLVSRPADNEIIGQRGLVGVVKTQRTRYLADESILWNLPAGWRSPRFKLPAGTGGPSQERYSCYLRLHDSAHQPWDFGLIRVEAYVPELLDELCARCLAERQGPGGDRRWATHIRSVRGVEEFLRSRRPVVFGLSQDRS